MTNNESDSTAAILMFVLTVLFIICVGFWLRGTHYYETREIIKADAVRQGYAEYTIDRSYEPVFRWKNPKEIKGQE